MFMGVNCGVALSRRGSWWPVAHRVSREKVVVPHVNHRHIITVLALLVIVSGCAYAYERESLRSTLDTPFARINAMYFDGQLSGVQLRWGLLGDDYGQASDDGSIVVDSWSVKDRARLDEVFTTRIMSCGRRAPARRSVATVYEKIPLNAVFAWGRLSVKSCTLQRDEQFTSLRAVTQ
jgi:hypothetical protein